MLLRVWQKTVRRPKGTGLGQGLFTAILFEATCNITTKIRSLVTSTAYLTLGSPIRFDVFCTPRYYVLAYNLLHLKAIVFIFFLDLQGYWES